MIPCQQTRFAAELRAAIGNQYFGFAHAAWVQENLPGQRINGGILRRQTHVEAPQRHPGGFTAPPDVEQLFVKRKQLQECCARQRRFRCLETPGEPEWPGGNYEVGHTNLPLPAAAIFPSRKIVSPRRIVRRTMPRNVEPTYGLFL